MILAHWGAVGDDSDDGWFHPGGGAAIQTAPRGGNPVADERQETGDWRMSELDKALDRLGDAVLRLVEGTSRNQAGMDAEARIAELTAECERLQAEVDDLRAQREVDARLRNEAAEAVRDALSDLRGLVAAQGRDEQGDGNV